MRVKHRTHLSTPQGGSCFPKRVRQLIDYRLEMMEPRMLLSVAMPAGWEAHPANFITSGHIKPAVQGSPFPPGGAITPRQMAGAYGLTNLTFGAIQGNGAGQTIGIVDAYDDPTAAADLLTFDQQYNLPAPPSFIKLNDQGLASPLPITDPAGQSSINGTWEEEESLDVQWAHAMAPGASIILFEAANDFNDLFNTVAAAAASPGVSVISMSWAGDETSTELSQDSIFTTPSGHTNITFLAAAGDSGAYLGGTQTLDPQYPATSPNVIAVGGTTLNTNGANYGNESAWGSGTLSGTTGGGGGGISLYEPQPAWQSFLASSFSSTFRTYPDVSMEADPSTGVDVVDSWDYGTNTPWESSPTGGTSLATPMFAGVIAIADQDRVINGFGTLDGPSETLPHLYNLPAADFHDITSGSNGYSAGISYDLATGRGSPVGNLLIPDLASAYIGSHVFNDVNTNGIQDAGETGLSGITVNLETGTPGAGSIVSSTTTDAQGFYEFTAVTPGANYFVNFAPPTGYQISPQVNTQTVGNQNVANPVTGDTAVFAATVTSENYFENAGMYLQTITITPLVSVIRPHSGVAPMVFTVTLAPVNLKTTDVPFTTADGTATVANADYQATSGTLVFAPGVVSEIITVNAIGNLKIENDVSYYVNLTIPTGYVVAPGGTGVGTGLIQNSNFPVATIIGPPAQTRAATANLTYVFDVNLSAPAPFVVNVDYTTVDDTATAGGDYVANSGTLSFPAGTTTEPIDVIVLPGTNRQLNKTFFVQISQSTPQTSTIGTPSEASGIIDTNLPPGIAALNGAVTESLSGLAYLPMSVEVTPALSGPVSINYTTSDGTAKAGVDYVAQSGTLTFTPGRIIDTVYIPIPLQFIAAQTKTLDFTITDPVGDIIVTNAASVGTISYIGVTALDFSGPVAGSPGVRPVRAVNTYYDDSLGQRVTVSLRGPGSGEVVFLGNSSFNTNAYEIILNSDTDPLSTLSVRLGRNEQTTVTNLIADTSIGAISAPQLNVTSAATINGSAGTISIGYLDGATLSVGGVNDGPTVAMTFNRVANGTINSAIPIRTLTSGAYVNTTGGPIYITAPSVGAVRVHGNFGGTIRSSTLQSLQVSGTIQGGAITGTSIGSITAGALSDATFFAGVAAGTSVLPTETTDFANATGSIGSLRVQGVFSNSLIAASNISHVLIQKVDTVAGGTVFGLSAKHFGQVKTMVAHRAINSINPTISTNVDNFAVNRI